MLKYGLIIFDLDGTLLDTGSGIMDTLRYVLGQYGIKEDNTDNLRRFIGPPLLDGFINWYGFTPEQADEALEMYHVRYEESGMYMNTDYPGIRELLSYLREKGCRLAVATGKPEYFARKILEKEAMADFFDFIGGSTLEETRTDKQELIEYVCANMGVAPGKQVLMIGDRASDIIGAHRAGCDGAGVLFGYGSEDELKEAGSEYIAASAEELKSIVD